MSRSRYSGNNERLGSLVLYGPKSDLEAFLKEDVSVEEKNTVLMFAIENGKADFVKVILDAGANMEAKNKDGDTALIFAVRCGKEEIVQNLLDAGADKWATSHSLDDKGDEETALTLAVKNSDINIVRVLLKAGVKDQEVSSGDSYFETAGRESALIKKPITALRLAVDSDRLTPDSVGHKIAKEILASGAAYRYQLKSFNIDSYSLDNLEELLAIDKAIIKAAKNGDLQKLQEEVKKGNDLGFPNRDVYARDIGSGEGDKMGLTALQVAVKNNQEAVVNSILSAEKRALFGEYELVYTKNVADRAKVAADSKMKEGGIFTFKSTLEINAQASARIVKTLEEVIKEKDVAAVTVREEEKKEGAAAYMTPSGVVVGAEASAVAGAHRGRDGIS